MTHFKLLTWPVSVLAIATSWWLPLLKSISDISAILLPTAGLVWILLQAGFAIWDRYYGRRERPD